MTAISKSLADDLINHVLRNTSFTSPTDVYVALHDDGGGAPAHPGKTEAACYGNELNYTSYQRQSLTMGAPSGSEKATSKNSNTITFPEVDAGEGPFTVTGISIWAAERGSDVGSSGQLLFSGAIDAIQELKAGDAGLLSADTVAATIGEALP